jgi:hypothetical protein
MATSLRAARRLRRRPKPEAKRQEVDREGYSECLYAVPRASRELLLSPEGRSELKGEPTAPGAGFVEKQTLASVVAIEGVSCFATP